MAKSGKYPFSLMLLVGLAAGLLLSWCVLFFLFFQQGDGLRLSAVSDGRYARIDLKTGAVEGNVLTLAPPPAPAPIPDATAAPATVEVPAPAPEADNAPVILPQPAPSGDGAIQVADLPAPAVEVAPVPGTDANAVPPAAQMPTVRAPLNPAPNAALVETVGSLALPKKAPDGMSPSQYYRKPFTRQAGLPMVAVLVRDLGLHKTHTQAALGLDENVTFAFSPYASNLAEQTSQARLTGHEFWLQVPMEPEGYPANDAGPFSLLRTDSLEQNLSRLHQVMGLAVGYVGLVAPPTELFSASRLMGDLAEDIRTRGLLMVQHQPVMTLPRYDDLLMTINRTVAPTTTPEQLRIQLTELEAIARSRGHAVLSLPATPGLLAELPAWLATLPAKKLALAPLSAVSATKSQP